MADPRVHLLDCLTPMSRFFSLHCTTSLLMEKRLLSIRRKCPASGASCSPDTGNYGKTAKASFGSERGGFLLVRAASLCWQPTCSNRITQIPVLPSESPSPMWQPQQTAQGCLVQGRDLFPVCRDSKRTQGARDTLKAQTHARPN